MESACSHAERASFSVTLTTNGPKLPAPPEAPTLPGMPTTSPLGTKLRRAMQHLTSRSEQVRIVSSNCCDHSMPASQVQMQEPCYALHESAAYTLNRSDTQAIMRRYKWMQGVAPHQILNPLKCTPQSLGFTSRETCAGTLKVHGVNICSQGQQHWRRSIERARRESMESCAKSLPLQRGSLTLTITLSTTPSPGGMEDVGVQEHGRRVVQRARAERPARAGLVHHAPRAPTPAARSVPPPAPRLRA